MLLEFYCSDNMPLDLFDNCQLMILFVALQDKSDAAKADMDLLEIVTAGLSSLTLNFLQHYLT